MRPKWGEWEGTSVGSAHMAPEARTTVFQASVPLAPTRCPLASTGGTMTSVPLLGTVNRVPCVTSFMVMDTRGTQGRSGSTRALTGYGDGFCSWGLGAEAGSQPSGARTWHR